MSEKITSDNIKEYNYFAKQLGDLPMDPGKNPKVNQCIETIVQSIKDTHKGQVSKEDALEKATFTLREDGPYSQLVSFTEEEKNRILEVIGDYFS